MSAKKTDTEFRGELFDILFWGSDGASAPATSLIYRSGAYSHFEPIDALVAEDRPARRVTAESAADVVALVRALSRAIQSAKFEPMPKDEDEARKARIKERAKAHKGGKVVWLFGDK